MKPIVFLIYNNVIILITLVAMFNSYYFALLSVLLILGDGRPITANSDIYIYIYIYPYFHTRIWHKEMLNNIYTTGSHNGFE